MEAHPNSKLRNRSDLERDIQELEVLIRQTEQYEDEDNQIARSLFMQLLTRRRQQLAGLS